MRIITTRVVLHGLYAWGKGYENEELMRKWEAFWDSPEANSLFWHSFKVEEGHGDTRYLVTVGGNEAQVHDLPKRCLVTTTGSIYLHPMDFQVMYQKFGRSLTYKDGVEVETFPEIEELEEIVKRCCAFVGCTYTMEPIKSHVVNQ